jgi:hypothetical protein
LVLVQLGKRKVRDFKEDDKQEEFQKNEDQEVRSLEDRLCLSNSLINDIPNTISQVDLPPEAGYLSFVHLSGDKLYTGA